MSIDHACERCRRDDVEEFVDIASTPMRRVVRGDPSSEVNAAEAMLVCEECAEDFGARSDPAPPAEFVASEDRTAG